MQTSRGRLRGDHIKRGRTPLTVPVGLRRSEEVALSLLIPSIMPKCQDSSMEAADRKTRREEVMKRRYDRLTPEQRERFYDYWCKKDGIKIRKFAVGKGPVDWRFDPKVVLQRLPQNS